MEKKQKIMIGWGLVFLLLIPAIFLAVIFLDKDEEFYNNGDDKIEEKPQIEYSILPRNAENSSLSNFYKLNVFGGTKSETARKQIVIGDKVFVIGETSSNDNDFKANKQSLFIAEFSSNGTLNKTFIFAEECKFVEGFLCDFRQNASIIVICENGKSSYIYSINLNLTVLNSTEISHMKSAKLHQVSGGFAIIYECLDKTGKYSIEICTYNEQLESVSTMTVSGNSSANQEFHTTSILNGIAVLTSDNSQNSYGLSVKIFNIKSDFSISLINHYNKNQENLKALQIEKSNSNKLFVLYLKNSSLSYLILDYNCNIITDTGEKDYSAVKHSIGTATSGMVFPIYNFEDDIAFQISGFFVFGLNNGNTTCDIITHDGIILEKDLEVFRNCGKIIQYIPKTNGFVFLSENQSSEIIMLDRNKKITNRLNFADNSISNSLSILDFETKFALVANIDHSNTLNKFGESDILFALIKV